MRLIPAEQVPLGDAPGQSYADRDNRRVETTLDEGVGGTVGSSLISRCDGPVWRDAVLDLASLGHLISAHLSDRCRPGCWEVPA
jgi:hypothetical protein